MTDFGIVGLLGILGFESIPRKLFEWLCINYCNEKLQAKLIEDIFRSVQLEYEAEGVPFDEIKDDDNTDVLDPIEGTLPFGMNREGIRSETEKRGALSWTSN